MSETDRIWDQLQRTFEGGDAWRCPSLRDLLATVSAPQAAARPIAGAPTIWELLLHATVYENVVRRRLEGEHVETLPDELGWPRPADTSAAAWLQAKLDFGEARRALRQAVAVFPDRAPGRDGPGARVHLLRDAARRDRARSLPRGPDRDADGGAGCPAVGRADVDAPEPPPLTAGR